MAVAWDDYLREVQPYVAGCPTQLMLRAVRNAAIELANESSILRANHAPIDSVVDQTAYPLTAPANTDITMIINAMYDDSQMDPLTETDADHLSPAWRNGGSLYGRYYQTDPAILDLAWEPSEAVVGAIDIRFAYRPSIASTSGDDLLFRDWLMPIAAGAMAKLKAMPKERWSADATLDRHEFIKGKSLARIRGGRGHTFGGGRVQMRPLVGGRNAGWR